MPPTDDTSPEQHSAVLLRRLARIYDSDLDKERRRDAAMRLRFWREDVADLVRRMPHEDNESYQARPKYVPPLVPHALRELSYLWDEEPTRSIEGLDGDDEATQAQREAIEAVWRAVLWDYAEGLRCTLSEAQPLARLLGQVHVRVDYVESPDAPRNLAAALAGVSALDDDEPDPGVELVTLLPDTTIVLPNDHDPRFAQALAYLSHRKVDERGKAMEVWHYFDDAHWAVCEVGAEAGGALQAIESPDPDGEMRVWHPHSYGCMPFVPLRWRSTHDCYWAQPWGGADLISNMRAVADLWSQYLWTAMLQRGQPAADGEVTGNGGLAPDSIIVAPGFKILGNGANLTGIKEALVASLEVLAKTMGLPSRTFRLGDQSAQSGVAIALDRAELEDDRRAAVKIGRRWERNVHRMAARVWREHTGQDLPWKVTPEFKPFSVPLTADQRQARVAFELAQGLISKRDAVLELHPGMSPERAEQRLGAVDDETTTRTSKEPLNGAQLLAVIDLLLKVSSEDLSVDAAAILIPATVPQFTPESARAMVAANQREGAGGDEKQRLERVRFELEHGLIGPIDALLDLRPNIDEAEAARLVAGAEERRDKEADRNAVVEERKAKAAAPPNPFAAVLGA